MKFIRVHKRSFALFALFSLLITGSAEASGVTIGSGATVTESGNAKITTNGDWDNNGTFVAGAGTVELNGLSSTFLEAGGSSFNNLIINKTDGAAANDDVTVQTDGLSVSGALTITDGELIQGTTNLSLGGLTVAAAGAYTNASTGDLTLSGAVSNAGVISFDAGGGGAGGSDTILIRSSSSGVQRNWQGSGTFSMTDVDVQDQTALGGTPANIVVSSGTNSGNNINWLFGGVTIAGTAYTSKAELGTLNNKNLRIVQYRAGNTTIYTTTTGVAGAFSLPMTDVQDGDVVNVFLDDEAEEGVLIYISDGLNVSDLKLYQDAVALRNDSGTGVTNADLAGADNGDDDIKYAVSSGNATFETAFELFIFSGSTYAPGGDTSFHDLDLNGTFTMAGGSHTVSGAWDATGGAYSSTGTVTFTSTSTENLTSNGGSASAAFNHVVFNGAGGQWDLQDGLDVDGNLTITAGTLNANGNNINIAGNWTTTSTFTSGSGTAVFDGSGTQVFTAAGTGTAADDAGKDFNDLTVSGSTLQVAAGSELEVDGTLTVQAAKTLDLNAATLDLNGTLQNLGTVALEGSETLAFAAWDSDSGTTRFYGDSFTFPALFSAFFNLDIDETANGQTYTLPDGPVTVNGVLTITDGILAFDDDKALTLNDNGATGTALSVAAAGTLSNLGTGDLSLKGAVSNAGTITFNSSDDAGNGISILSVGSPTQRNWQGGGAFSMTDVTVQDQTVLGGSPPSITALSSTNSGNNVNWLFGGGSLSGVTVTPADLQAGHSSNNTVVFTTSSAIPSNGKVRVTFPAGFNVALVTTATSTDLDGTLAVSVLGQDVTITRSGGTNFPAGGLVDDLVIQGVVNPAVTGPTGPFTVTTLDAADNPIDTGTAAGVTIVPSTSTASSSDFVNNTGASTASFTIGSTTTGRVYVRITDTDENTAAGSVETITVTVTSAATGDSEAVTLTETGVNTGVFDNTASGLVFDADDAPASSNGTLETRDGDTITASYVDDDDGTDTSSDTALINASTQLIVATFSADPQTIRVGEAVFFKGTIENRTSEALADYRLVADLPPGVVFEPGSASVSSGTFTTASMRTSVTLEGMSAIAPGESREVKFRAVAGSGVTPGSYPARFYAQFNPIISNTAQVTLTLRPDPVFHVGTLIGKVFWDINRNGVQDEGEIGIPNATIGTEQGHVITTDQYGRYHVPDFLSGRHMIKIDRNSLPAGSRLTTAEAIVVTQTDAMLNKVNFGVLIPEEAGRLIDTEREADISLLLRQDPSTPKKSLQLQFHEIVPGESKSMPGKEELVQTSSAAYETPGEEATPVLPFRIDLNYAKFISRWSLEINRYTESQGVFEDSQKRKRETIGVAKETGAPMASAFRYRWTHPLYEGDKKLLYEMRVVLEDAKGNQDVAVYDLDTVDTREGVAWTLSLVDLRETIPVRGTSVVVDGTTHANKIVSVFGREDLSSSDGRFSASMILPEGNQQVPVQVYLEPGSEPVSVSRQINLRDTYFFWVGFSEYEMGTLDIKGAIESVTPEDKARFQDEWYDESRVAYYLKGKIKGKYLVTASVDTDRAKREMFRNLEPEDYYAVYGDGSTVTADANDTQDKYFLLVEVDKSSFKYGNFNTDLTGTEFADFTRTLHGAKLHYETLATAADGKAVTLVKVFSATARQVAARNEFRSTGGGLYYLKHQDIVMGSEKIKVLVRDKITGITLSERSLSSGADYSIDYDQGRLRLYRPLSLFTEDSGTILSTELLPGHPQYVIADYEHYTTSYVDDLTQGARVTQSLLGNQLRIGGTYVTEEKALKDYELKGTDAQLRLPFDTMLGAEYAESSMTSSGEFASDNGGLTFSALTPSIPADAGTAYKFEASTTLWTGADVSAYYRTADPGFASNGSISESGTVRSGFELIQPFSGGEFTLKHHEEELLPGAVLDPVAETLPERMVTLAQARWTRGAWDWTAEFRETVQTGLNERLVGLQGLYHVNPKTRLTLTGQKSLVDDPNDQLRAQIEYDWMPQWTLRATQAVGNRGWGSQVGVDTGLAGSMQSFSKATGILKEPSPIEAKAPTTVGFSRKIGQDSELQIDRGIGDSKKRTLRFSRTTSDGRVIEMVRESGEGVETSTYSETQKIGEDGSSYQQTSVQEDKLTGRRVETKTQGYKAKIWNGRATVFNEQQSTTDGDAARTGSLQGVALKTSEFGTVSASYERNQDKVTTDESVSYQVGRLAYEHFEYERLQLRNDWEVRRDDNVEDTLQLLSTGKAKWQPDPEWAVVGRYEWSFTENETTGAKFARFSELQTGLAYRPVRRDNLNFFAEYKYLADVAPTGQIDLDAEQGTRRQIVRGEMAFDVHPMITLVEKLALRDSKTLTAAANEEESMTYMAAQRINFHLTDRWDVIGEYRFSGQTLASDTTHGYLIETSYRVTDSLRVAVGYSGTKFESDLVQDLNVETEGFYVRVFYDAIEEVRGVLESRRARTEEIAQKLRGELDRVTSIQGSEKSSQEMRSRLSYAHQLMEKMLYEEAIEVLQDGLERYEIARNYADKAQQREAQFQFYLKQGRLLRQYGLPYLSFKTLEKAYKINAFHEGLLAEMSGARADIQAQLVTKRAVRKEQREAFERLKAIQEPEQLLYDTIQLHYVTGRKYLDKGLPEQAMEEWQRGYELAKKVEADYAAMRSERGEIVAELESVREQAERAFEGGDYEGAQEHLKRGVKLIRSVQ